MKKHLRIKFLFITSLIVSMVSAKGPVFNISGKDTVHVYSLPGISGCYYEIAQQTVSASDSVYGDLTPYIIYKSNLNCAVSGWYTIKMLVKNPAGDSANYTRTIHVIDATHIPNIDFETSAQQEEIYYQINCNSKADSGAYIWEWTATSPQGTVQTSNQKTPTFMLDEIGKWTIVTVQKIT